MKALEICVALIIINFGFMVADQIVSQPGTPAGLLPDTSEELFNSTTGKFNIVNFVSSYFSGAVGGAVGAIISVGILISRNTINLGIILFGMVVLGSIFQLANIIFVPIEQFIAPTMPGLSGILILGVSSLIAWQMIIAIQQMLAGGTASHDQ